MQGAASAPPGQKVVFYVDEEEDILGLTRYAMGGFELGKELSRRSESPVLFVFEALTNSLFGVVLRGNIEQVLMGLGVLHHCRVLAVLRRHRGALGFVELLHDVGLRLLFRWTAPSA